ncbi:benzoate transporter BenE [Arsenicitalea aurantiaca]|uniref:Benzoate transporter BenE n=1 Tax=Arsenicitalea aurantiaca TaxID=1783274 RepID=A0A433XF95_9HYPH|nr:benzoate/H(+) symporter BenE family transporter [Arsenicitalea aurantiaca]RUT32618.1 benzoate transporter BenE [Arsenicitalea aurantiaca]
MTTSSPSAGRGAGLAQPIIAGLLAAIVGYASTFTLALASLGAVGATPAQAGSGLFAICTAVGVLNIVIAWRTRLPMSFAWSTPGIAFLLTVGAPPEGFGAVAGAFLVTALLIVIAGVFKPFARAVAAIPGPIANAMLAGILLTLCLAPVNAVAEMPVLALPIVAAWALGLVFARRYAVPLAVLVALIIILTVAELPATGTLTQPLATPVMPIFTFDAIVRIALPLFVITMASQNLPGIAVMRANGYPIDPAPHFVATGVASGATALLGGQTVNLAAITAAITAGPEAHPDPARRWVGPVTAGATYIAFGLTAGLAATLIAAAPPLLIQAVAGLALLSSLASAMGNALEREPDRLPAILTFVTTASGITILGIGAAFWGLIAGIGMHLVLKAAARRSAQ